MHQPSGLRWSDGHKRKAAQVAEALIADWMAEAGAAAQGAPVGQLRVRARIVEAGPEECGARERAALRNGRPLGEWVRSGLTDMARERSLGVPVGRFLRTVPGVAPTCRSTRDEGRAVGKLVKRRRTGSQKDCEGSVFSIREPPSNADPCHYREVHYGRGGLPRFREKTLFRDHAIRRIDRVSAFRRLRFARVPPSSRTSIHQNSSLVSPTVDWYGANDGDGGHGVTTGVITVRFFAKMDPKRPCL